MKNTGAILFCLLAAVWIVGNSWSGYRSSEAEPMPIKELSQVEDLQELVDESPKTIIIDFYADWCGPCRKQSEVLSEVANEMSQDAVRIIKVNVDKHPALAAKFQVTSIPSLFIIENQQVRHRHVGLANTQQIVEWLGD